VSFARLRNRAGRGAPQGRNEGGRRTLRFVAPFVAQIHGGLLVLVGTYLGRTAWSAVPMSPNSHHQSPAQSGFVYSPWGQPVIATVRSRAKRLSSCGFATCDERFLLSARARVCPCGAFHASNRGVDERSLQDSERISATQLPRMRARTARLLIGGKGRQAMTPKGCTLAPKVMCQILGGQHTGSRGRDAAEQRRRVCLTRGGSGQRRGKGFINGQYASKRGKRIWDCLRSPGLVASHW